MRQPPEIKLKGEVLYNGKKYVVAEVESFAPNDGCIIITLLDGLELKLYAKVKRA